MFDFKTINSKYNCFPQPVFKITGTEPVFSAQNLDRSLDRAFSGQNLRQESMV
jgi:hypothetical protein